MAAVTLESLPVSFLLPVSKECNNIFLHLDLMETLEM